MAEPNTGDTAWLLVATALVMVMLPGLAFFYGGLVRRKNVLSTIMHSFFGLAIVSVTWVLLGYTLAFGPDTGLGLIGGLDFAGFPGVTGDVDPRYAPTIPHVLFAAFQLMFAAITPALITGALAERKRFGSFVLFTVLWSTLVYAPLAHWVWAPGGWLRTLGALDFAGGTVVHISSGVSAFVVALLIGRRAASDENHDPHDVPMTVLGAGLLWFGWVGRDHARLGLRDRGRRPAHRHGRRRPVLLGDPPARTPPDRRRARRLRRPRGGWDARRRGDRRLRRRRGGWRLGGDRGQPRPGRHPARGRRRHLRLRRQRHVRHRQARRSPARAAGIRP